MLLGYSPLGEIDVKQSYCDTIAQSNRQSVK